MVFGVDIPKQRPQAKFMRRAEKACASKEAYRPDTITQVLLG